METEFSWESGCAVLETASISNEKCLMLQQLTKKRSSITQCELVLSQPSHLIQAFADPTLVDNRKI